ncbi:zinc-binding dehydrogenase [Slackia heliotrinireducens]|uniref:zinc-binding dehydrogenase n=1 Tax=Slackia heliotrinireducens TaxID=84110 RepID=UPI0033156C3F
MPSETMRALVIEDVTPAAAARLSTVPVPEVKPGWALVRVRGFGMNHSEQVVRLEEIKHDYIKHPIIPGIELVGEIEIPSDSGLAKGQKVCALMGGMGRSWDGSYAEYCLVRTNRLFAIPDSARELPWSKLAAVPETFFTAWGSLFEGLQICPDDRLLIRGASCGLGYAAIQLAHALGCTVVATTHREKYRTTLERFGADTVIVDSEGSLAEQGIQSDKVLELIGAATLRDSLGLLAPKGICCHTGILGGAEQLEGFDPIKDIPNGRYLTGFFSNYPTQETITAIFEFVVERGIEPYVTEVFSFDRLTDAIALQDEGGFQGKLVVVNE